jgi:predicted component of type VI protein secretion system
MIATLIVTKGEDNGKVFRLGDDDKSVIGRSSSADVIIQDPGISRQHCHIRAVAGQIILTDLNSKNGTAVNGRRVRGEIPLENGDVIELGRSCLKVQADAVGSPLPEFHAEPEDALEPPILIEAPPVALNIPESPVLDADGNDGSIQIGATLNSDSSLLGAFEEYLGEPRKEDAAPASEQASRPALRIQPIVAEPPAANTPDLLIGNTIAGCRIEEQIGSDEISLIYRGLQVSMERPVTIKILVPEMTHDQRAVKRFVEAARAGGKLNHPNIVQVFDAGEDDGTYFIAMELVDGDSIRELLQQRGRKRGLDQTLAVDVARQVAEALAYAHEHQLVHRNVNPDTVLVTRHGIAKLAEMGTAQSMEDSGLERPSRPGELVDALHFSAPEIQRDPRAASPLSDVYSLGAVLFMALTGHPPFRGTSELEIMNKVQDGEHEPLQKLQRSVPDELAQVVEKAMAAKSDQRYQSAAELERDLRRMRELLR